MEVKDIIRTRRLELGLTMKDVAKAVGVSEGAVSRWESGDVNNMRRDRIYALSQVLQISPLVILGLEQYPADPQMDPEKSMEENMLRDLLSRMTDDQKKELINYMEYLLSKK